MKHPGFDLGKLVVSLVALCLVAMPIGLVIKNARSEAKLLTPAEFLAGFERSLKTPVAWEAYLFEVAQFGIDRDFKKNLIDSAEPFDNRDDLETILYPSIESNKIVSRYKLTCAKFKSWLSIVPQTETYPYYLVLDENKNIIGYQKRKGLNP